ncbi:MAG: hypothetical protein M3021_07270 [Actinomycetota bacterium]|nr:hypothetical protein [Actinomycetota bacterium]
MADGQDATALMSDAASGDEAAVHALLAALSDGDGKVLEAMLAATDLRLWHGVLRVAARAALDPPGSSTAPPHLNDDAETLFLLRRKDASDTVRRQALLEGLDSAESSVRAEAATLLGEAAMPTPLLT